VRRILAKLVIGIRFVKRMNHAQGVIGMTDGNLMEKRRSRSHEVP
jgi:hypothetical protein